MAPSKMGSLPVLRRQHLLVEFAGLKQSCPPGVFVSLTPGDPSLWSGVLFVRKGPYAPAILRFQISFPDSYPALPPLITFSTDMFHPLITPLTNNYMYSGPDSQDSSSGGGGADAYEALPPGGFSLRHGFPRWFARTAASKRGGVVGKSTATGLQTTPPRAGRGGSATSTPASKASPGQTASSSSGMLPAGFLEARGSDDEPSTYDVLLYVKAAFDDAGALDGVPLAAAANPGAWHAWRTHRRGEGKTFPEDGTTTTAWHDGLSDDEGGRKGAAAVGGGGSSRVGSVTSPATKRPEEWNWEGVWEDRVKKGVAASLSEPVVYGNAGGADELIRFLPMEDNDVETVKDNLFRTLEGQ